MESEVVDLQGQFNILLQTSEKKPEEAKLFPQFLYMETSLKKSFKLLKKSQKVKISDHFGDFWKELSKQEQIHYYMKSVRLLELAVRNEKPPLPVQKQSEVLIKKSMVSKWEKKLLRLTAKNVFIQGSKGIKAFELHKYALRKSKNKDCFAWVLEATQKAEHNNLHCGVNNIKEFEDWYNQFDTNINYLRVNNFLKAIANGESMNVTHKIEQKGNIQTAEENIQFNRTLEITKVDKAEKKSQKSQKDNISSASGSEDLSTYRADKTLTQIALKNQMAHHQEQLLEVKSQRGDVEQKNDQKPQSKFKPNVFKRLMPEYNIANFTEIPPNSTSIHCDSEYRLAELATDPQSEPRLKLSIILPFPKSYVFKAITEQMQGWNSDIQTLNIKTSIRSQNAAIVYQKHKAQGILYRERDYLYLRHCFSIEEEKKAANKQNKKRHSGQVISKTFIVDKSIDSVHHPPFMTVARGQKLLIWCLVKGQTDKQCLLVVQGLIRGGGYMNNAQNKDMTIKHFKAITQMVYHLKHKTFGGSINQNLNGFFRQDWLVTFDEQLEQKLEVKVKKSRKKKSKEEISPEQTEKERAEKERQLEDFMKQQQFHQQYSEERASMSNTDLTQKDYRPPPFYEDGTVNIPNGYLTAKHQLVPQPKTAKPGYAPHYRGHHLWKGEWQICPTGGLNYVDEEKMAEQRKVVTFIIKRIGKNILTGKGILNVSLPVDIFCLESNIERMAMSFGFCPGFLEKAAEIDNQEEQMKHVIAAGIPSSLIYLTMEKPFNPILGETYQCWMDGCPIYFEQVSHHPPIASFLMKGRGYEISGSVEAKMDLSINSGTGYNDGIFTVSFKNGNIFYYTTPKGQLQGLTYGVRRLNMVQKAFYWSKTGLFVEIQYNPYAKKKGFFGGGGNNYVGEERFSDYFEGTLKRYDQKEIVEMLTPKKDDVRQNMIIPKGEPPFQPKKELYKVEGRCFKYIKIDGEVMFDVDKTRFYPITDDPNPLPSHANFREDIVYRRMRDFVKSQEWKQKLEVLQRKDRKGREQTVKKTGKKK